MDRSYSLESHVQYIKYNHHESCQDSGYKETLNVTKVDDTGGSHDALKENQLQVHCSPDECCDGPRKSREDPVICPEKDFIKENLCISSWCETPKISKKDSSLRRRLLMCKAATDGKTSTRTPESRPLVCSGVSVEEYSSADIDSPEAEMFQALATSTLKVEELTLSCRKRRLMFSQVKTSTLEDGSHNFSQPPISENLNPEFLAPSVDLNESIVSALPDIINSGLFETPRCIKPPTSEEAAFQTPVTNPSVTTADNLSILSTLSFTPISKLDVSASEDSGFTSLGLDKSQDSSVDHDGSFQELLQHIVSKSTEVPRMVDLKRRSRLERHRRLSTLREGGSQSDGDLPLVEQKDLITEEDEQIFLEKTPLASTTLKFEDLSLTPALQTVHAICQRSAQLLQSQHSVEELLRSSEDDQMYFTPLRLAWLIGRKMGLEKLDILTELKMRNLRHILSKILNHLSAEDVHRFGQVSNSWNEIILQDKLTQQRRKSYLKDMMMALEMGNVIHAPDAESRLNLLSRSALRSVQAQSKVFSAHTPVSIGDSLRKGQQPAHSASKRDKFLQVAKTLFSDECLRPCPRCQHPAKCHSVKREGVCSHQDCAFQFCTLCLCAYHGSKECGSASSKRRSRKEVLPGSARSKRNLRRL